MQREVGIHVAVECPSLADPRPSPRRIPAESDRLIGTVACFHDRRGDGFNGGHGADVFVHHSNITATITEGQRVAFAVRDGRKGLEADDVVAV